MCYVYSQSKPKITWKTIDIIIIDDFKYKTIVDKLEDNKYICTLEILKTSNEKDKEISCVIKNEYGTIHSTFSIQIMGHYKSINKIHGTLNIHDNFKKISLEHRFTSYNYPIVEFYNYEVDKQNDTPYTQHFLKHESNHKYLNCMTIQFIDKPKEVYSFLSVVRNYDFQITGTKCFIFIPKEGSPILEKSFQEVSTKNNIFEISLHVKYISISYPIVRWYGKRGDIIISEKNTRILARQCDGEVKYETILKIRSSFGIENNIFYCLVKNSSGFLLSSFTCNY
uniref:Ig-like domain-containing protein n=1 Tax=Strongyloides venezuelensis TaxID=75913 RepID=A0A0K0EYS6_STRVS